MDEPQPIFVHNVANAIMHMAQRFRTMWVSLSWDLGDNAHVRLNNAAPAVTGNDVFDELHFAADRVRSLADVEISPQMVAFLQKIEVRCGSLVFDSMQIQVGPAILSVLEIANAIARRVPWPPALPNPEIEWENLKDKEDLLPLDLYRRLRSVADQLNDLEPRTLGLDATITQIEKMRATARQLPTDMADLSARRQEVRLIAEEAATHAASILSANEKATAVLGEVEKQTEAAKDKFISIQSEADKAINAAELALRGATSVGLARSFEERQAALQRASWAWTGGLLAALIVGGILGWDRYTTLKEVLVDGKSTSIIWANVLLTIVAIGGPVWFAWLSTKQLGTTFRLSEDYAFKASVSKAYEGYRSEAVSLNDDGLRNRLFEAALDRFEEAPIRLVDTNAHSSPLQELLSHPAIKKQIDGIPSLAGEIIELIKSKAGAATAIVGSVATATAVAKALNQPDESVKNKPD